MGNMASTILSHDDLQKQTEPADIVSENPAIENVVATFDNLRFAGDYLAARVDGGIRPFHYTNHVFNRAGLNNHFQGIKRLRAGQYIVVSGGDETRSLAHLFFIKMATKPANGFWRANIVTRKKAPGNDKITTVVNVDRVYWHGGGMDTTGDILAVPVESSAGNISKIVFYHVANPEAPRPFAFEIVRPHAKVGAVALTRLPNKHYLLAAWSDSDKEPLKPRLEIYLSRTTNFFDGFPDTFVTWDRRNVEADFTRVRHADFGNFQTVNFIRQSDGKLFLAGMHNTSDAAPVTPGDDWVDLYEVTFPSGMPGAGTPLSVPKIKKIANHKLAQGGKQYNLDAAGGIYFTPDEKLCVYAGFHWKVGGEIKFAEFSPAPASTQALAQTDSGWVELYEHDNFRGRMVRIYQDGDSHFRNYKRVYANGESFDDKVSSARFQLPPNVTYSLFKHRDYKGTRFDLVGNGAVQEIPDFKNIDFGDKVSSSRFV
jgi:hypothetical protein